MLILTHTPDHLGILTLAACMAKSILEAAHVLTLIIWPNIDTLAITQVVFKLTLEATLVPVICNSCRALKPSIIVPLASVSALPNLDYSWTHKLALRWMIVRCSRPVSHYKKAACLQGIFGPDSLNLRNVAIFEGHLSLSVQFVVFHLTLVTDTTFPFDLEVPIHPLAIKSSLIQGRSFLILALVPLVVGK